MKYIVTELAPTKPVTSAAPVVPLKHHGEQQRQSTPAELVEWLNALSSSVGSGVRHLVDGRCTYCGKDRDSHYDMIYCYVERVGNKYVPRPFKYVGSIAFERYDSMGKLVEKGIV